MDIQLKQLQVNQSLTQISQLIQKQLAEPYSIFTYKYFLIHFPQHCIGAYLKQSQQSMVGLLIGKIEKKKQKIRGYLAMIVVKKQHRQKGIGKILMQRWMKSLNVINVGAIKFYQRLGFIRTKRLANYYMSGNEAYRFKYIYDNINDINQQQKFQ